MPGRFLITFFFLLTVFSARSQYYYKDILLTRQNQAGWKSFHDQKVREVNIQSIDANNEMTPGFTCTQTISPDFSSITTFTKSADIPASTLTVYYDRNGRPVKTVDTSDTYKSTTEYNYNENGEISSMLNNSEETDNHVGAKEKHLWIYEGAVLKQMIKIKGETDTTIVDLIKDEKGNIVEEKSVRGGQSLPSIYYYFDNEGRLTDIVRYSKKAARLLPDYVFEYKYDRISSMLFVPTGSTDYQKWIYDYNSNGLKATETCYDKKKQVVVKINYTYSFR
jgi:YD repeat-containing protein